MSLIRKGSEKPNNLLKTIQLVSGRTSLETIGKLKHFLHTKLVLQAQRCKPRHLTSLISYRFRGLCELFSFLQFPLLLPILVHTSYPRNGFINLKISSLYIYTRCYPMYLITTLHNRNYINHRKTSNKLYYKFQLLTTINSSQIAQ